jgi:hypothetical protein
MDLANRYEIGLIPVFFNPFGDLGGGLFSGVCVKLIRTFQEAWWFVGVDDPGVHSQFFANASVETGGTPPFFVTNHESASNGTDGMVAAWLQFVGPASIKLTASGVKGTSAFTNAATISELPTGVDFEAKVVGVTYVGIDIPTGSDRFRVVWLQYGELQRADLLLSTSGLSFAAASVGTLAGNPSKAVTSAPDPHLHSGRVHSSMADKGVLFTHKGGLRFLRL